MHELSPLARRLLAFLRARPHATTINRIVADLGLGTGQVEEAAKQLKRAGLIRSPGGIAAYAHLHLTERDPVSSDSPRHPSPNPYGREAA